MEGMIDNVEMHRVLKVISDCQLCLWHPVMEDDASVWKSQVAMIEKRGGNLAAPVPMPLGESGYINELSEDMLKQRLQEYKEICMSYPRQGAGIDSMVTKYSSQPSAALKNISLETAKTNPMWAE